MSNEQVYAITNLDGYAKEIRLAAANMFSDAPTDDIDSYISVDQITNLVKKKCLGFDDLDRPMLNETINEGIYEDVAVWIHNVGLARLAGQDLIECAWDNETNEMVFWAKSKEYKSDVRKNPG